MNLGVRLNYAWAAAASAPALQWLKTTKGSKYCKSLKTALRSQDCKSLIAPAANGTKLQLLQMENNLLSTALRTLSPLNERTVIVDPPID